MVSTYPEDLARQQKVSGAAGAAVAGAVLTFVVIIIWTFVWIIPHNKAMEKKYDGINTVVSTK